MSGEETAPKTSSSPYTAEYIEQELGPEFCSRMASRGTSNKWTPARWAKICHAVYLGCSKETACGYAGITTTCLVTWRQEFPELQESLDRAGPEGVMDLVQRLDCDPDSLTARWRLERRAKEFQPPVKQTEVRQVGEPQKFIMVMKDAQGSEIPVPPEISGEVEENADD